jgi:hypothetical protein
MMKRFMMFLIILTGILSISLTDAAPTRIVVRAKSKDAKFIGTSMGGARVVIKDSATGKVLAEGLTSGSTGSTKKIMMEPKTRFGRITDASTAKFEVVINIEEPRLVTVEVDAPYGMKPKTVSSSTQIWLIPGKDISGEGLILEVPGFSINTSAVDNIRLTSKEAVIPIQSRIVMI